MLLGLYLSIVVALPLALGSYVMLKGMPRSRRCPRCAGETLRIASRPHALASRLLKHGEAQRRWCVRCDWQGTARVGGRAAPPPILATPRDSRREPDRVDLRRLMVDGDAWRVMVECWAEGGRWLGRLIFVAPSGQAWPDERPMEGGSPIELLSRAFSLSEQTLAGRLRRVIR